VASTRGWGILASVVRSAPSRADQELIHELAASGSRVSATQLERWRAAGLLPRPRIKRLGIAGTAAVHPPGTAELAASIARHGRRGRPFEVTALAVFIEGYPVPDDLLLAGVRRIVTDFATEWTQCRSDAVAAVEAANSGEPVDELAVAEQLALQAVRGNGRAVRQWRRSLRRNPPPPDATPDNREEVLAGALTSVVRLLVGDAPEHDDSLAELAAAAGASGAFETAPFADSPVVPEGPSVLRAIFTGYDIESLRAGAESVTAEELRHGLTVFVGLSRLFLALPEQLRHYLGVPGLPVPDPKEPEGVVLLLLSFLAMSQGGLDLAPILDACLEHGVILAAEAVPLADSARWLNARGVQATDEVPINPFSGQ
jgi:hypothetical protein